MKYILKTALSSRYVFVSFLSKPDVHFCIWSITEDKKIAQRF
jgi:hypothetical protein